MELLKELFSAIWIPSAGQELERVLIKVSVLRFLRDSIISVNDLEYGAFANKHCLSGLFLHVSPVNLCGVYSKIMGTVVVIAREIHAGSTAAGPRRADRISPDRPAGASTAPASNLP